MSLSLFAQEAIFSVIQVAEGGPGPFDCGGSTPSRRVTTLSLSLSLTFSHPISSGRKVDSLKTE